MTPDKRRQSHYRKISNPPSLMICRACFREVPTTQLIHADGTRWCKDSTACDAARLKWAEHSMQCRQPKPHGICEWCGASYLTRDMVTADGLTHCKDSAACRRRRAYVTPAQQRDREARQHSRRLDGLPEGVSYDPRTPPTHSKATS